MLNASLLLRLWNSFRSIYYLIRSMNRWRLCNKPSFWSRVIDAMIPAFISSSPIPIWQALSIDGLHVLPWPWELGEGDLIIRSDIKGEDDIDKWEFRSSKTPFIVFVTFFTVNKISLYNIQFTKTYQFIGAYNAESK